MQTCISNKSSELIGSTKGCSKEKDQEFILSCKRKHFPYMKLDLQGGFVGLVLHVQQISGNQYTTDLI